ncbi:MAG: ribosome small subunit-dependent GTPase A, partial [Bacilli bacterium]|nr:ribosome small subunit-dependent GTPase A [Bacilli bacterium]
LEHNKIIPIICITKYDLLTNNEQKQIDNYIAYYQKIGYTVLLNTDIAEIKRLFKDKTTVFTGQTGAGKSTLLNKLDKNLNFETGEISLALGRGKHTTRHVELVEVSGGKVLDTPGFSSIDFRNLTIEDIKDTFIEFSKYPCPYKDCRHLNEKECQIKEEVLNGNILESRYNNYLKFIKEKW